MTVLIDMFIHLPLEIYTSLRINRTTWRNIKMILWTNLWQGSTRRELKMLENIFSVHFNVNSLQNKIEEVLILIGEFKAQVVFLTETKIDGSYPNSQFAIER